MKSDSNRIKNSVNCQRVRSHHRERTLFISDKLSCVRSGKPQYFDPVSKAAETSLDLACYLYIRHQLDHGLLSMPHGWLTEAFSELTEICSGEIPVKEKVL